MAYEDLVDYSEIPLREGLYHFVDDNLTLVYVYKSDSGWFKEYPFLGIQSIESSSESMRLFPISDPESYVSNLERNVKFAQSKLEQLTQK